eukprot:TRINITY_DN1355_c3_g1_i2.p1 TRINITY_DN1355_c3_g1~~TRINITY_DN1355_c3_g1_i2.p1  ORF type:complete len:256 (+),score=40.28 TRINITY_DN1355_c3_g1_i2:56-823(+)
MSLICQKHGKSRTLANLVDMGNGEYRCKPDSMCKSAGVGGTGFSPQGQQSAHRSFPKNQLPTSTAELMARGHAIINPEKPEMCHAHGKIRSPAQLYQVMTDQGPKWECLLETRCKVSEGQRDPQHGGMGLYGMPTLPPGGNRYNPYGASPYAGHSLGLMAGGRQAGSMNRTPQLNSSEMCSIHRKRRSSSVLEQAFDGTWRCRPGDTCKTGGTETGNVATCSAHGKLRKMEYLTPDDRGNFICTPQYECQASARR